MTSISDLRLAADLHAEKALVAKELCVRAGRKVHGAISPAVGSEAGLATSALAGFICGQLASSGSKSDGVDVNDAETNASVGGELKSMLWGMLSRYAWQELEPLLPELTESAARANGDATGGAHPQPKSDPLADETNF